MSYDDAALIAEIEREEARIIHQRLHRGPNPVMVDVRAMITRLGLREGAQVNWNEVRHEFSKAFEFLHLWAGHSRTELTYAQLVLERLWKVQQVSDEYRTKLAYRWMCNSAAHQDAKRAKGGCWTSDHISGAEVTREAVGHGENCRCWRHAVVWYIEKRR